MSEEKKVYVEVTAVFTEDGRMLPKAFRWEDGTEYEIARIKNVCRAASRKAGGAGVCYTCVICGQEKHLYYEENNRWFLEKV